jgi:hypothetical protein
VRDEKVIFGGELLILNNGHYETGSQKGARAKWYCEDRTVD